ncbi:hypothetical protein [Bacillus phage SPO1L4]|nr:hypothetical protein [Bacillus phage SPO1L4]
MTKHLSNPRLTTADNLRVGELIEFRNGYKEKRGFLWRKKKVVKRSLYRIEDIKKEYRSPTVRIHLEDYHTGEQRIVTLSCEREMYAFVMEEY